MMMQLNPSIPVETPKGKGQAVILIDYSAEHDLYWVVFIDESRECWTFNNKDIRIQSNFTLGRPPLKAFTPSTGLHCNDHPAGTFA